ncbi:MAG TPA: hypothetical protein VKT80_06655, partial [Chloroflexota bacterium]|nr:hypothetical protein [Chloroflexota bacterium]
DTGTQYPDGVYFVSLAAVVDPALVPTVIAQVLRAPTNPGQTVLDDLKEFLRDRKVLLILDSFEPVLSAAPVVAELLAGAPRLKVLVTSRARLQLRGEREYSVPSLAVPESGRLAPVDRIAVYPAIRLFVDRARDARSDFELTDANASPVAEICRRLDGLPLAIELAAARIKIFPPSTLLARLENRLKVLTGGARDLPLRKQTLRNTIAWSYDLLDESERKLFRSLAVFNGGWTLEAAIAICSDPEEGDEDEILAGLASLTDKSLLRETETTNVAGEPESRFRLSQTVRDFALEYLSAASEARDIERRHAEYYLAFAEGIRAASGHSVEPARRQALEREHHNLRAARRWAEENDSELHARLVEVVDWFGHILVASFQAEDVASDLERRLTKARLDGNQSEELRVLTGLVEASYVLALDDQTGRASARARECYIEGERLARSIGDRSALARLLLASLMYHGFWPDFEEQAQRNAREAIALSREIGDEDLEVSATIASWQFNNRVEAESQSRDLVRRLTERRDFARLNAHYFQLMWSTLLWG